MRTVQRTKAVPKESQILEQPWVDIDDSDIAERAASILSASPRPFIRWAGSKQRLLAQLVPHLPKRYRNYYEPFLGAASMYFALRPPRAVLNDSCGPLIEMYRAVSRNPHAVLERLSAMNVLDKELYYQVRKAVPLDMTEAAARFIYLNRAAWNGLYRVNARGEFNVPYGNPRSANIVDERHLIDAATQLSSPGTVLTHGDFEHALKGVADGDLVFLDPPYASSKRRETFVDYNEKLFTWEDQVRLASRAEELRKRGAHVIVTNAYNSSIRELYPNFREHGLVRRSSLAADVTLRRPVAESVLVP